jgi:GH15 family glucan-1,4-alpha-glucosidase
VTHSCPITLNHGVIGNGRVLALVSPNLRRLENAYRLFEQLMTLANCVGLFSEDIEPRTGMLLGNFPQAYTHVGLINTAVTINGLLEARDARFRAWN